MRAKVKLKIKYEGPITFSKEIFVDYNNIDSSSIVSINYELKVFLLNIKTLSQSITYWNNSDYIIDYDSRNNN